MTKLSFSDCCSLLLEHQIENMIDFVIFLSLLLSMFHTKVSLVPDIFSPAFDRSFHRENVQTR
jgi:hypothetical protein